MKNSGERTKNFLSKTTRTKSENYFFDTKNKQKAHYLVWFWHVFVPRETGGQNQIVPRETYVIFAFFTALHPTFIPFLSLLYQYNRVGICRLFAIPFRCFYGYFGVKSGLVLWRSSACFVALFERISPCFFASLPPSFSLSNRCFCLGLEYFNMATKEIC